MGWGEGAQAGGESEGHRRGEASEEERRQEGGTEAEAGHSFLQVALGDV